jgi:hypothetical protein
MTVASVLDSAEAPLGAVLDITRTPIKKPGYSMLSAMAPAEDSASVVGQSLAVVPSFSSEGDSAPGSMTEGGMTSDTGPENDTPPESPSMGQLSLDSLNAPEWVYDSPLSPDKKRPAMSTLPSYLSSLTITEDGGQDAYDTEMENAKTIRASTLQKAPNGSPRIMPVDASPKRPAQLPRLRSDSLRVVIQGRKRRSTLDQLREQWDSQKKAEAGQAPLQDDSDEEEDDRFSTIKASSFSQRLRGSSTADNKSPRANRPPKLDLSNISVLSPGPPSARMRAGSIKGRGPGFTPSSPFATPSLPPPLIPTPPDEEQPQMELYSPDVTVLSPSKSPCPFSPTPPDYDPNQPRADAVPRTAPIMEGEDEGDAVEQILPLIDVRSPDLKPVILDVLPSPLDLSEESNPDASITAQAKEESEDAHLSPSISHPSSRLIQSQHARRTSLTVSDVLFKHRPSVIIKAEELEEENQTNLLGDEEDVETVGKPSPGSPMKNPRIAISGLTVSTSRNSLSPWSPPSAYSLSPGTPGSQVTRSSFFPFRSRSSQLVSTSKYRPLSGMPPMSRASSDP